MLKVKPWKIYKSDTLNVAHGGYLVMQIVNLAKIQAINRQNRLGLVAIDKAHLVYEWDFRQMYKRCEELHVLLLNATIMALSATVTVQVENALRSLLSDPVVSRSTVNHDNVYLAVEPCNFKRKDGSWQTVSLDLRDFNNFTD